MCDATARCPAGRHFLKRLLLYAFRVSRFGKLRNIVPQDVENVSDGQLAVASPSVPLDRNVQLRGFLTGLNIIEIY